MTLRRWRWYHCIYVKRWLRQPQAARGMRVWGKSGLQQGVLILSKFLRYSPAFRTVLVAQKNAEPAVL